MILKFEKKDPVRCPHCLSPMRPRSPSNDPAFCSYICGVNGQREHVQQVVRNTVGFNPN